MNAIMTFDNPMEPLQNLLNGISDGQTQLPDFQRGWVWDDEHIRSLLASVSLSYPIGAVMMLQGGNPGVRFQPRLVEGVTLAVQPEPERLILDGQQRLTALFQSLHAQQPVTTRDTQGRLIRRWYYIDIAQALGSSVDREDTIRALPEDRIVRNFRGDIVADYSTEKREYQDGLFPLTQVFDPSDWRNGFNEAWDYDRAKIKLFDQFEREVLKRFQHYQIPVIILSKDTPKEAVCHVFEKVNTGGVPLTVFELLTATFAADNFRLRNDWAGRERRLRGYRVLRSLANTDFLQAVTLLATLDRKRQKPDAPVSCKRKDVLDLSLAEYQRWADPATTGFEKAAKLLHAQRIFDARDLPYRTQLVPLAAILAALGDRAENDSVRQKLARWYWCGVFGELYGSAIETRFARDLPEVLNWIDCGTEPSTVQDANFAPARLLTLRTRNSAAYKGLSALLLRDGSLDFRSGDSIDVQMYFDERVDIHHIFPRGYCARMGIDSGKCECIVNKTFLSSKTNRMIGGNAPHVYLDRLQKHGDITSERMDDILRSHVIDPSAIRSDDFDAFFAARQKALLERIEQAMGKAIARDIGVSQNRVTSDFADDEIEVEAVL